MLAGSGAYLLWVPRTTLASSKVTGAVDPSVELRGGDIIAIFELF